MVTRDFLLAAALSFFVLGSAQAKPLDAGEPGVPETPVVFANAASETDGTGSPHVKLMRFLFQEPDDPAQLRGYRVAILAADGVDGFDLEIPRRFLTERGATVQVIVPRPPRELQSTGSGVPFSTPTEINVLNPSGEEARSSFDRFVDQVHAADYDAVYVPANPARWSDRVEQPSIEFLQDSARTGRPIFAVGNSSLILLEAGLLDHKRATGDEITRLHLAASSAKPIDAPLVSDGTVHTSRDAFDMPDLMQSLVANLLARPLPAR